MVEQIFSFLRMIQSQTESTWAYGRRSVETRVEEPHGKYPYKTFWERGENTRYISN